MTWRRCSEEMPESHEDVLVWLANNWGATVAYVDTYGVWYGSRNDDWPISTEVVFWQPITPPDEGTPHGNSDERTA